MNRCLLLILAGFSCAATTWASALKLINHQTPKEDGAEIISYTADGFRLASVFSGGSAGHGVQIFTMDASGALKEEHVIDLGSCFKGEILSVSSVALDPLGRGLGAAVVIPKDNARVKGRLMIFAYREGKVLGEGLETGFHPDSVCFSPDGRFLLVANEGEFTAGGSAPGSLTVVDVSDLKKVDMTSVAKLSAQTYDFRDCKLDGIRSHEPGSPTFESMEPEYVSALGDRAYVSLQENNALATFDLKEQKWLVVRSLGTITQTIDANDQDKKADISQKVAGMPMPDTIAAFEQKGLKLLATANEGDSRPDDFDRTTVAKVKLDSSASHLGTPEMFGRLEVSGLDGDTDKDGDIDVPTMFGTRSFSLWNADTGKLVFDSGSLETPLLEQDKSMHNADDGNPGKFDKRSSKKGPEPEALAIGRECGRTFLFVAMERQNGVLMYDMTDPEHPLFAAYANTIAEKLVAPESLVFVPAASSPTGKPLLLGGYELNGGAIAVFEVAP